MDSKPHPMWRPVLAFRQIDAQHNQPNIDSHRHGEKRQHYDQPNYVVVSHRRIPFYIAVLAGGSFEICGSSIGLRMVCQRRGDWPELRQHQLAAVAGEPDRKLEALVFGSAACCAERLRLPEKFFSLRFRPSLETFGPTEYAL